MEEYVVELLAKSMRERYEAEMQEAQANISLHSTKTSLECTRITMPERSSSCIPSPHGKATAAGNNRKTLLGALLAEQKILTGENYLMEKKENKPN